MYVFNIRDSYVSRARQKTTGILKPLQSNISSRYEKTVALWTLSTIQKAILISLISIAAVSWVFSNYQRDMMKAMTTYDPIALSLFTSY